MANVLPTEEQNGSYDGRQTRLGPCQCGNGYCTQPTSFFVDTGEICPPQTFILRRLPSAEHYAETQRPLRLAEYRKEPAFQKLEKQFGWEFAMFVYG